jgi:hypothetical protein
MSCLRQCLNSGVDSEYRPHLIKTLVRLSRLSRLYPECLVLNEIKIEGNSIASGASGDVYKGRIGQQTVAVKMLRIHWMFDRDKLLKVI